MRWAEFLNNTTFTITEVKNFLATSSFQRALANNLSSDVQDDIAWMNAEDCETLLNALAEDEQRYQSSKNQAIQIGEHEASDDDESELSHVERALEALVTKVKAIQSNLPKSDSKRFSAALQLPATTSSDRMTDDKNEEEASSSQPDEESTPAVLIERRNTPTLGDRDSQSGFQVDDKSETKNDDALTQSLLAIIPKRFHGLIAVSNSAGKLEISVADRRVALAITTVLAKELNIMSELNSLSEFQTKLIIQPDQYANLTSLEAAAKEKALSAMKLEYVKQFAHSLEAIELANRLIELIEIVTPEELREQITTTTPMHGRVRLAGPPHYVNAVLRGLFEVQLPGVINFLIAAKPQNTWFRQVLGGWKRNIIKGTEGGLATDISTLGLAKQINKLSQALASPDKIKALQQKINTHFIEETRLAAEQAIRNVKSVDDALKLSKAMEYLQMPSGFNTTRDKSGEDDLAKPSKASFTRQPQGLSTDDEEKYTQQPHEERRIIFPLGEALQSFGPSTVDLVSPALVDLSKPETQLVPESVNAVDSKLAVHKVRIEIGSRIESEPLLIPKKLYAIFVALKDINDTSIIVPTRSQQVLLLEWMTYGPNIAKLGGQGPEYLKITLESPDSTTEKDVIWLREDVVEARVIPGAKVNRFMRYETTFGDTKKKLLRKNHALFDNRRKVEIICSIDKWPVYEIWEVSGHTLADNWTRVLTSAQFPQNFAAQEVKEQVASFSYGTPTIIPGFEQSRGDLVVGESPDLESILSYVEGRKQVHLMLGDEAKALSGMPLSTISSSVSETPTTSRLSNNDVPFYCMPVSDPSAVSTSLFSSNLAAGDFHPIYEGNALGMPVRAVSPSGMSSSPQVSDSIHEAKIFGGMPATRSASDRRIYSAGNQASVWQQSTAASDKPSESAKPATTGNPKPGIARWSDLSF